MSPWSVGFITKHAPPPPSGDEWQYNIASTDIGVPLDGEGRPYAMFGSGFYNMPPGNPPEANTITKLRVVNYSWADWDAYCDLLVDNVVVATVGPSDPTVSYAWYYWDPNEISINIPVTTSSEIHMVAYVVGGTGGSDECGLSLASTPTGSSSGGYTGDPPYTDYQSNADGIITYP